MIALRRTAWTLLTISVLFTLGSVGMGIKSRTVSPTGTFRMYYASDDDGNSVEAWGLTYAGPGSLYRAWAQVAAVVTAGGAAYCGRGLWRKLGLAGLVAWHVLWVVGIFRVMAFSQGWWFFGPWFALVALGLLGNLFLLAIRESVEAPPAADASDA